jgi:hypothetical protein
MVTTNSDVAERSCVLCGSQGKLTKEHVLPNWLRKYASQYAAGEAPSGGFSGSAYGKAHSGLPLPPPIVVRMVCEQCNGWMSDTFEVSAKPHLIALIEGTVTHLDANAVSAVARWINKSALMYALTAQPCVFDAAAYHQFRETGDPVAGCGVFVGTKDDPGAPYSTKPPTTPLPEGAGVSFWIDTWKTTLGLGALVVHYTWTAPGVAARTVADRDGLVLPIWPVPPDGITWPPPRQVTASNASQLGQWVADR